MGQTDTEATACWGSGKEGRGMLVLRVEEAFGGLRVEGERPMRRAMRIIAGSAGGITITVPKTSLRPTADRVREAVFSKLGELVEGAG